MPSDNNDIEKRLWNAADQLWANTGLLPSEYAAPVLGLLFLRYAEKRFAELQENLSAKSSGRRTLGKTAYQAQGVVYLPEQARFSALLRLPEGTNLGKAINDATAAIEEENEDDAERRRVLHPSKPGAPHRRNNRAISRSHL